MSDNIKFPCNAYKMTILVLDHEQYCEDEIKNIVESPKYANVHVVNSAKQEIQWHDDHPLNNKNTWRQEFDRLFECNDKDKLLATLEGYMDDKLKLQEENKKLKDFLNNYDTANEESISENN